MPMISTARPNDSEQPTVAHVKKKMPVGNASNM